MEEFIPKMKQQTEEVSGIKACDKISPLNEAQQKLVEQGYEQVKTIANTMFYKTKTRNSNFQPDDFISWGTEGLIEAAKKFDGSKNAQFYTFASYLIKGRILDNLREQNTISRRHLKFLKDREEAIKLESQRLKRKPTEKEIAEKMNLALGEYFKYLKRYSINAGVISLADTSNDGSSQETDSFLDKISQEINPYGSEDNKEFTIDLLKRFLARLNLDEKEHQVMDMYFIEDLTLKEIGERLGLTEPRISQIKSGIIKRLRKLFEQEGYKISRDNSGHKNKSQNQELKEFRKD